MYKNYVFWLVIISISVFFLERIFPWREQKMLRKGVFQDLFWLVFNGYFLAIVFMPIFVFFASNFTLWFKSATGQILGKEQLLAGFPFWGKLLLFLLITDFIEWCVHNMLHRIGWLWKFHRVHHSITTMDWLGNFRFHFVEVFVYKVIKYLPLMFLTTQWEILLSAAVIATAIGHINHSNLKINWGPLRFLINSPRMHIWHHEKKVRGKAGKNFGVVFSIWDWIFRTAYMPDREAPVIGFHGQDKVPEGILYRFFIPFYDRKKKQKDLGKSGNNDV